VFGPEFPYPACIFLCLSGNVGEFFGRDDFADVLFEELQNSLLTSHTALSDSIDNVPSACRVQVRVRIDEHVLVRLEIDSALRVRGRSRCNLVPRFDAELSDASCVLRDAGHNGDFNAAQHFSDIFNKVKSDSLDRCSGIPPVFV